MKKSTGSRLRGGPAATEATPFLRRVLEEMKRCGFKTGRKWGVDLGAGNGRNAAFMARNGVHMRAYDPEPADVRWQEHLVEEWNGTGWLPGNINGSSCDVILLQYVLMFCDHRAQGRLISVVDALAKDNCVLVLEAYAAKDSNYVPAILPNWGNRLNNYAAKSSASGTWCIAYGEGRDHLALQFRRH